MPTQQLTNQPRRPSESLRVGFMVIDFQWRYVHVNPTAAAHGRRSVAELEGLSMLDLYPDIENTAMFRILERCMNDRVPDEFDHLFTYADGESHWFAMRVEPVREGISVYSVDIHERKLWRFEMETTARALGIQPLTERQWRSLMVSEAAES